MPSLLHHLLDRAVAAHPQKEALVHGDRRVSYTDMATYAANLAGKLSGLGLNRRDRVAIWLEKSVEEAVAFFGVSAASGVIVPINTLLVARQVRHILNDCGVRFIITSAEFLAEHRDMVDSIKSLDGILLVDRVADPGEGVFLDAMTTSPTKEPFHS